MSSYADHDVPIIVRGEGPTSGRPDGKRYLDGLAGPVRQPGRPRPPRARRGRRRSRPASSPTSRCGPTRTRGPSSWPSGWPHLAPGDLNRVFFTTGGSEAVESAWKLARQYFQAIGEPGRYKVISRDIAYHGTTMGALSITGLPRDQEAVRAARAGRRPGAEHQLLPGARASWPTTSRRSAAGPPTRSSGPSCVRAPSRSPRSSSSRCRTPAAASRRRPATSPGCARSATATASSWSPTRSSARSAGSATTSARSATATSPTSSPSPRA